MPQGTLGELVLSAHARVRALGSERPQLERGAAECPRPRPFGEALRGPAVAVIAEVKRRSPSKGALDASIDAAARAAAYARGGAAAISVLTEPERFGGSLDDLRDVTAATHVPVLRKDFIVDELQIIEARAYGASAVLLIARALEPSRLETLVNASRSIGVEPLVEVRDRDELTRALDCGADVIGVNARNLETLVVDESVPLELLRHVPASAIAIAESGISDRAAIERLASAGADAVLVGSVLSVARDPEQAVRELHGVARARR